MTKRASPLRTFGARAILMTCATAVVSVIVTAAVAFPVAVRAANTQVRESLTQKALLVGEVLSASKARQREAIVDSLRQQNIAVYLVRRGVPDQPGLPTRILTRVAAGDTFNTSGVVGGRTVLVAARQLTARGNAIVLTHPAVTGNEVLLLGNLWIALLAGLAAGLVAGGLLARVVARPVRDAAVAAGRLTAGDRTVRLPVRPPVEVSNLAVAFNQLATALATSEDRQRDFLLSVSHELRTPLTTIRGYAEALADGVIDGEASPQAGRTVLGEAERLDRLVADLLVLARLEAADLPLEVVPVDLVELIRLAGDAWGPRCAADRVPLRCELADAPVMVHTDPGRIRQVVDGLCENALRVVPPGAALVLAARTTPTAGVVEVRDGGPGFTDDDLAVAFERGALHQRYHGIRKVGSGLGLALASRLVRRLGGTIEAGHADEGGARFTVALPFPAAPPQRSRTSR